MPVTRAKTQKLNVSLKNFRNAEIINTILNLKAISMQYHQDFPFSSIGLHTILASRKTVVKEWVSFVIICNAM
jgi:hypothetical protein